MTRRRIEMQTGAIRPVSRGLWHAAYEKLHEAARAIESMRVSTDRIKFENGWTQFVDSLEEFWTRFFDEGRATFSSFQPWAGALDAKRKADPLLQYLYQSRHQSQHGRISLQWEQGKLLIAPDFTGSIRGLKIFPDGTYEMDATPAHSSQPDPSVVHSPGAPLLPVIENRKFGQKFPPPDQFDGAPLVDATPIGVAQIGLSYYVDVLSQAQRKFDVEFGRKSS